YGRAFFLPIRSNILVKWQVRWHIVEPVSIQGTFHRPAQRIFPPDPAWQGPIGGRRHPSIAGISIGTPIAGRPVSHWRIADRRFLQLRSLRPNEKLHRSPLM